MPKCSAAHGPDEIFGLQDRPVALVQVPEDDQVHEAVCVIVAPSAPHGPEIEAGLIHACTGGHVGERSVAAVAKSLLGP